MTDDDEAPPGRPREEYTQNPTSGEENPYSAERKPPFPRPALAGAAEALRALAGPPPPPANLPEGPRPPPREPLHPPRRRPPR